MTENEPRPVRSRDLYVGSVTLADGRVVAGMRYPRDLAERHGTNISSYGDWRAYLSRTGTMGT